VILPTGWPLTLKSCARIQARMASGSSPPSYSPREATLLMQAANALSTSMCTAERTSLNPPQLKQVGPMEPGGFTHRLPPM